MTAQQIKQRLLFIIEDANRLLNHIESGKALFEPTDFADCAWTHLSNIQIAADLEDTESDTWKGDCVYEVGLDQGEQGTITIASFTTLADAESYVTKHSANFPSHRVFIDTCTYNFTNERIR